jgi:hypothetical protein
MLEELEESEGPDVGRLCQAVSPTMSHVIIPQQFIARPARDGSAMRTLRTKPGIRAQRKSRRTKRKSPVCTGLSNHSSFGVSIPCKLGDLYDDCLRSLAATYPDAR